tara:strand:+ start:52 stop:357 length:306 start_codon:yes stop_codon:yes gene_type:complete
MPVCTQDFAVTDIVRIGVYNADKTTFTKGLNVSGLGSLTEGTVTRTNILSIADSVKIEWTGYTSSPQAYFEEEGCASIQKKSGNNWIGAGPATYNEAGQKQ